MSVDVTHFCFTKYRKIIKIYRKNGEQFVHLDATWKNVHDQSINQSIIFV